LTTKKTIISEEKKEELRKLKQSIKEIVSQQIPSKKQNEEV
jgi:hypothetical protein